MGYKVQIFGPAPFRKKMYTITTTDLGRIKEFALDQFHRLSHIDILSQTELQQFLIIQGLYDFLKSQGVEPNFAIEDLNDRVRNDNYEIVED